MGCGRMGRRVGVELGVREWDARGTRLELREAATAAYDLNVLEELRQDTEMAVRCEM